MSRRVSRLNHPAPEKLGRVDLRPRLLTRDKAARCVWRGEAVTVRVKRRKDSARAVRFFKVCLVDAKDASVEPDGIRWAALTRLPR